MQVNLFCRKKDVLNAEIEEILELVFSNFKTNEMSRPDIDIFKVHKVGRILESKSYNDETEEYYNSIGVEMDIEMKFDIMEKSERCIGFYSVWRSSKKSYNPINFEDNREEVEEIGKIKLFYNAYGDSTSVTKEIYSAEKVQQALVNLVETNPNITISK